MKKKQHFGKKVQKNRSKKYPIMFDEKFMKKRRKKIK